MSLTDGTVRSRFLGLWLPMIGGILAVKAVGLADAYFVGQLGEEPLAAISFTFPIVMTLISLAIGLSAGASSVLARAIGNGAGASHQRAIVTGAIAIAVATSLTLSLIGFLAIRPVLDLMGASGAVLEDAVWYMRIWFAGAVFMMLPIAINGLLRSTGDGVSPAVLMSAVALLNIGLNPVFIYGLGPVPALGMQGAATATLAARLVSTVAALALLHRKKLLDLTPAAFRGGCTHWREIIVIGLPASLSTSLNPIALSIATAAAATLGPGAVAAYGVATKMQSFAIVPLLALSSASSPFVGQNSGAGEIERSRQALFLCAGIALAWSVLLAALMLISGEYWVSFFGESQAVRDHVLTYLTIVPISFAGYGMTISLSAALNGLGHPVQALMISGGRAIGLLAPAVWAGVLLGDFPGIALATVVANVLAGAIALTVILRHGLTPRPGSESTTVDSTECD